MEEKRGDYLKEGQVVLEESEALLNTEVLHWTVSSNIFLVLQLFLCSLTF